MSTRRGYRCVQCHRVEEIAEGITQPSLEKLLSCSHCGGGMQRYFGNMREVVINYGRPSRSLTGDDQDIAEFQFRHL